MSRCTQRRDARNGKRHALAEDMRMVALEALLPNSSDTANSSGHGWTPNQKLKRRSRPVRGSKWIRCTQAGSNFEGSRGQR